MRRAALLARQSAAIAGAAVLLVGIGELAPARATAAPMAAVSGLAHSAATATLAPTRTPSPAAGPEADGIKVGDGSYAPEPPTNLPDYSDVSKTENEQLHLDPSLAGKPVPTNQWWTNALVSNYSGQLWSYPLVSQTTQQGTVVEYPDKWNSDGTGMVLDNPITIGGQVVPTGAPSDEVLADFEDGVPAGWDAAGDAFADVSEGTEPGQSQVSGWTGSHLLNSFTAASGDGATGTLTSAPLTLNRSTLAFQLGGGDHPGDEAVELIVGGRVVDSATGHNSEQLQWIKWDVSAYSGQSAQLKVVDDLQAGWAHVLLDQVLLTDDTTNLDNRYSTSFDSPGSEVTGWGDWSVSLRQYQTGGQQHIDSTIVQGDPFEWFQFTGMTPRITVQDDARITDDSGMPLDFPVTTDRFEITEDGHSFGIHAPADTTFRKTGNTIDASAGTGYLVVSAVPDTGMSLDDLQKYAFALPTDTKMAYSYDPGKGRVAENWSIATRPLQGSNTDTIQGWEKHQYKDAANNLDFTKASYATPRGTMKTTIGHDGWSLDYTFEGIPLIDPTPEQLGLPDDYDPSLMKQYVDAYAGKSAYGGDTYWGGKDLQQLADYMMVAKQIGDTDAEAKLESTLRTALTDWFTYTDGETQHFFAAYPTWKALIGFSDSYGSAQFNDNHFHYGYFAVASALLGAVDPSWAQQYGQMATMVVQEYGDWDRTSTQFPYLRTFGVWEGHSNAGGVSSPGGNNQESSSEAIQSEAGEFLLGSILGDKKMQATGAMEYVTERAAVREYYQNASGNPASASYDGDGAFPPAYQAAQTGILYDGGQAAANYFSGDLAWNYAIQWLPNSSWDGFFGWDPTFSKSIMQRMMTDRPKAVGQNGTVGDNRDAVQSFLKEWWGVGTYGDDKITEDRDKAIGTIENAIKEAEKNDPGYVVQKVAANPLYDPASGTLYVSLDDDGNVVFPAQYWTPGALPASLVPPQLDGPTADKKPADWGVDVPLYDFLSRDFTADTATIADLYRADLSDYQPGLDTAHAEQVFSAMGDALGTSVLAFLGQYDPDTYADIHAALLKANDPMVSASALSLSEMVYYNAMSTRTVGTELTTRHTSDPLSAVYRDRNGQYSYVLYNPDSQQHSYDVYDGNDLIGHIAVPAETQITSHLDARLAKLVVTVPGGAKTIEPGATAMFTATGYDQYGATIPVTDLSWSTTAGSIAADGTFSSSADADKVKVTATSGSVSGSYSFRVAPKPVLTSLDVSPGFERLVKGRPASFTATGLDQYGDAIAGPDAITWSYTGPGTVDENGTVTTTGAGSGYVVANAGDVRGSAVTAAVTSLTDLARGPKASASANSELGGNTAALAIDSDVTSTRWESEHGVDAVDFTVDLGQQSDLTEVDITWENAAASKYVLQYADNADGPWHDAKTVAKTDASPDHLPINATARYVRMHGISRITQYGYSIWDFQVLGTPAASAIAPTAVLVSPDQATVLPASATQLTAYAFDAAGDGGAIAADWSTSGAGAVSNDGIYTAPKKAGDEPATVTATVAGVSGTARVATMANGDDSTAPAAHDPEDVAVGKPVSTSSDESAGLAGQFALDGSATTRWSSAAEDGQWIAVDLGQVLPISSIGLQWEKAYASDFRLEVRTSTSDDWTTVEHETAGMGGSESYPLSGIKARYVRMLGGTRATQYGYSLYSFEVYSTEGGPTPNLSTAATATASGTENPVFGPANAIDGDLGTRWSSDFVDNAWLELDLGARHALHSATLVWENAYGRDYEIQGSDLPDGGWTTIATQPEGTGGTDTLALSGSYRYVRFQGVKRATSYGYSLFEFDVR